MAGNARTHASDDTSNTARFFTDAQVTDWALHWSDVEQASRRISADRLLIVKYEDMLEDQGRELTRILRHLGVTASPAAMERCINESSFESMSGGRQRGEEDKTAHIRKGVAGDWRNHFTVADARLFDEITGDLLVRLGYESDRSWANASV